MGDPPPARHQPDEFRVEGAGEPPCDAVSQGEDIGGFFPGQVVPERDVPLRQHESVSVRVGKDVQDRERPIILTDPVSRRAAGHDLAEHAIGGGFGPGLKAHNLQLTIRDRLR